VLRGVTAAVTLPRDAALVNQIDDELELVQYLEVGDLRLVPGFHQRLEPRLDQVRGTTAEHRLLTEEVGLGFLGEGRLDRARTGPANALRVGEAERETVTGGILLDSHEVRHTLTVHKLSADEMARSFGSHQQQIHSFGWGDVAVPHVETVTEEQCVPRL